jgi:hypothetical protein
MSKLGSRKKRKKLLISFLNLPQKMQRGGLGGFVPLQWKLGAEDAAQVSLAAQPHWLGQSCCPGPAVPSSSSGVLCVGFLHRQSLVLNYNFILSTLNPHNKCRAPKP